jgi:hypothetical protein
MLQWGGRAYGITRQLSRPSPSGAQNAPTQQSASRVHPAPGGRHVPASTPGGGPQRYVWSGCSTQIALQHCDGSAQDCPLERQGLLVSMQRLGRA